MSKSEVLKNLERELLEKLCLKVLDASLNNDIHSVNKSELIMLQKLNRSLNGKN